MDDGKEAFQLVDVGVGVFLLCFVVFIGIGLYTLVSSYADEHITNSEESIHLGPVQRMSDLKMQQEPILCTVVASVIKDYESVDISYILISTPDSGVYVYTYSGVMLNGVPESATRIDSLHPTDDAFDKLVSYSASRCTLQSDIDENGYHWVTIYIQ